MSVNLSCLHNGNVLGSDTAVHIQEIDVCCFMSGIYIFVCNQYNLYIMYMVVLYCKCVPYL